MKSKETMLNKSKVKELGFTDAMIRDLLPEPTEKPNPHYQCTAPMKMWPESVVHEVMSTDAFADRKAKANARRASGVKATEKLFDARISAIQVERIPIKTIRENAIESKACHYEFTGQYGNNPQSADEETIERWMVNYIRHNLTSYDSDLFDGKGKVGIRKEYRKYELAVLDAIADAYPSLASECKLQKAPRIFR